MRAENLSVAAAFDLSYADLTAAQQRLFRRLGVAPGPDIDAYAAAALDDTSLDSARRLLDELYDHHLLTEPAPGRYHLLHDLLREYATRARRRRRRGFTRRRGPPRELLRARGRGRRPAHRHLDHGRRPPAARPAPPSAPALASSEQAAAWLESGRPNLHAAVNPRRRGGDAPARHHDRTAMGGFLRARGHWDQAARSVPRTALAAARHAGDRPGQAGALDELGLLQQLTGDYPAAAASLTEAIELFRDHRRPSGSGLRPQSPGPGARRQPRTTRRPPPATSRPWPWPATRVIQLAEAIS